MLVAGSRMTQQWTGSTDCMTTVNNNVSCSTKTGTSDDHKTNVIIADSDGFIYRAVYSGTSKNNGYDKAFSLFTDSATTEGAIIDRLMKDLKDSGLVVETL